MKLNKWVKLILAFIGLYLLQTLLFQASIYIYLGINHFISFPSNAVGNMVHHTIMFLLGFIPTIILFLTKKIDFGYRLFNLKKGLIFIGISVLGGFIITLIVGLITQSGNEFTLEDVLFQLFFSGLGEEIHFRAIPLLIFPLVFQEETSIKIKGKFDIDFGIILSAILFSLGHIMFIIGRPGISFSITQLISAFIMGIIFGYTYKKTKSIWLCMICHGVANVMVLIASYLIFLM